MTKKSKKSKQSLLLERFSSRSRSKALNQNSQRHIEELNEEQVQEIGLDKILNNADNRFIFSSSRHQSSNRRKSEIYNFTKIEIYRNLDDKESEESKSNI